MPPSIGTLVLYLATWPYYGTLRRYTLSPVRRVASPQPDLKTLSDLIILFTEGKHHELGYINLASGLVAALSAGVYAWPSIADAHWTATALLYASLILSLFSIVLGAQQTFLLDMVPSEALDADRIEPEVADNLVVFAEALLRRRRRKGVRDEAMSAQPENALQDVLDQRQESLVLLWMWQCPIMLVAWSWVSFLVAVTINVARPFMSIQDESDGKKVAISFFVVAGLTVANFALCSVCTYTSARGSRDLPLPRRSTSVAGPTITLPAAQDFARRQQKISIASIITAVAKSMETEHA